MKKKRRSGNTSEEINKRERLASRLIILISIIVGILITVLITGVLDALG
jgi:hypothetical protein